MKEAMKLALWHEAMAREPNRNQEKKEKHEATAKFIREALAKQEQGEPVAYTTGHCKEKAKAGGCRLHNIQCGFPFCDRKTS